MISAEMDQREKLGFESSKKCVALVGLQTVPVVARSETRPQRIECA